MIATSLSLLHRLKAAPASGPDWERFQSIYQPLILTWIVRLTGLRDEAADLAQDVFLIVFRELPGFDRRRDGAFRAWLRQITVNRLRTFWRQQKRVPRAAGGQPGADLLARLEDPSSPLVEEWDRQHDRYVLQKLLAFVAPDFGEQAWDAFRRYAIEGQSVAQVAADLGLSENAVLRCKSRILKRLREQANDLIS